MAFTHVLVPTDFSEPANHALRYAIEEAALHHATVTLLHVLPSDSETQVYYVTGAPQAGLDPVAGGRLGGFPSSPPTIVRRDPNEEAVTKLHDLIPNDGHDTWKVQVAAGHPADTIVRVARGGGRGPHRDGDPWPYGATARAPGQRGREGGAAGAVPRADGEVQGSCARGMTREACAISVHQEPRAGRATRSAIRAPDRQPKPPYIQWPAPPK